MIFEIFILFVRNLIFCFKLKIIGNNRNFIKKFQENFRYFLEFRIVELFTGCKLNLI